ncbi:MAG TPA: hypothetical protein VFS43_08545 [Polyangiaceae bacterium]|nr:hypothetical protein [Polyangiaceae bacterium]
MEGAAFALTGVAVDAGALWLTHEYDGTRLYRLGVSGLVLAKAYQAFSLRATVDKPFGLTALGQGRFVAASYDQGELFGLAPDGAGAFDGVVLLDQGDDEAFQQPAGIAVSGDGKLVLTVGSQGFYLGAETFPGQGLRPRGSDERVIGRRTGDAAIDEGAQSPTTRPARVSPPRTPATSWCRGRGPRPWSPAPSRR